ncbi:GntR family transcriptional regulator [Paenibacillus thermoaerophilus]|uniref:GntR family transcriptional regulator n=1 Tax=Paenibacillus thermoaerophilus TaxID=1215385 RepID=A0ABW2V424_9BACL|nr:GntR family transcriptional regulator [Paenibacillus thermoaerophilus]TMV16073.1 GntR family transcriptional regulator [Paenibacillus thermoaerophilus]
MPTDKPLPKYLQLKNEIMSWIKSGKLSPGDRMPTENEIAERFGISRQTVRQTFGVLEQEGLLQRMQGKGTYVSSPPARRREWTNAEKTIGVVTTYISDYIFPHIVRGAEAAMRSRGYRMLLASTDNDKDKERETLEAMLRQPIAGLIIEPTRSAEGNPNLDLYLSLDYKRIPYLMINERYPEMTGPYLKVDDEAGGFKATEHLIRLGHRRIAGFFKTDDLQGVGRLKGFIRAHQAYEVPLEPDAVVHFATRDKTVKPAEAALGMLMSGEGERPTAFVCYNDELAIRLLETIRQAGLTVPGDVSVVGFDDSTLATATEVKLTTLTHPKTDMGTMAAERLIDWIEGRADPAPSHLFEPELIVRDSTGPV